MARKSNPTKRQPNPAAEAMFGLLGLDKAGGITGMEHMMYGNMEADADLEAELLALTGETGSGTGQRSAVASGTRPEASPRGGRAAVSVPQSKSAPSIAAIGNLNAMDFDVEEDDAGGDVDENDPDLLAELADYMDDDGGNQQAPPVDHAIPLRSEAQLASQQLDVIRERQTNYQAALESARATNDVSKVRRYERGLATLSELAGRAGRGAPLNEEEIPPPVVVKSAEPPRPTGQQMVLNFVSKPLAADVETLNKLKQRQQEYKTAALRAKTEQNLDRAKELLTVYKQFDEVIAAVNAGEQFDLSDMPSHPDQYQPEPQPPAPQESVDPSPPAAAAAVTIATLEALLTRQALFKESQAKANAEGNDSKARRLGRIVTQYDEAVKTFRANRAFNYSELPPPPGHAALVNPGQQQACAIPSSGSSAAVAKQQGVVRGANMQQLAFLRERQAKFKAAALQAKNRRDLELAKQLLRQARGFDQMIQAAESGLPVDLTKLPSLPGERVTTVASGGGGLDLSSLTEEACATPDDMIDTTDPVQMYRRLQEALTNQMRISQAHAQLSLKVGDVGTAGQLDKLSRASRLDLEALKSRQQHGDPVPRFHYEWRTFTLVNSNPDLGDDEMELTLVRGIDLPVPTGFTADQLDTYVRLELPFPNDAPQVQTSEYVRRTNVPEYNATFKFSISRKARAFQRVVNSKPLKAELFYRRGLLKKDALLGTAAVRLNDLEKQATFHQSFDLMEGKKAIGGRLEVKARVREPILGKQVEEVREKWLVIDDFNRVTKEVVTSVKPIAAAVTSGGGASSGGGISSSGQVESIEVLMYERNIIQQKMALMKGSLTPTSRDKLTLKLKEKEEQIRARQRQLLQGGPEASRRYLAGLNGLVTLYTNDAARLKQSDRDQAQGQLTKKKLVEKEIAQLRAKLT